MIDYMLLISEYSDITLNYRSNQSKNWILSSSQYMMIELFEYVDDFPNFIYAFFIYDLFFPDFFIEDIYFFLIFMEYVGLLSYNITFK